MLGRFFFLNLDMLDDARFNTSKNVPPERESAPAANGQTDGQSDGQLTEWQLAAMTPLFALGRIVATPAAIAAIVESDAEPGDLLQRHRRGDWGDLSDHDIQANNRALVQGERLLSSYALPGNGGKIWIITEADRSVTTLLLPSEY